jgi:hypothetical protein
MKERASAPVVRGRDYVSPAITQPTGRRPLDMVYIGIDLHRKRSQVAALDGNGELLFNRRVATRSDELFKAIGDAG